jgi:succinoglycan biosynthesis transport protein ExoP
VILTALIATAATYAVSRALPDVYSAETALFISNPAKQERNRFEAIQSAQVLARTYSELIQSKNVATRVARELPGTQDPDELLDKVSFETLSDTQLLVITAEGGSPGEAVDLADAYGQTFIRQVSDNRLGSGIGGQISVASPAIPPDSPDRPRPALYAAAMFVFSLFVGGGLALFRERLDTRLGSDDEISRALGLPILARVPLARRMTSLDGPWEPRFLESYRVLWANLQFLSPRDYPGSILITSPGVSEGKSTACLALARVVAEQGHRVAMIEGDMRTPAFSSNSGEQHESAGLMRMLALDLPFESMVKETATPDMYLLPAGGTAPNPSALLQPDALERLISEASSWGDLVIVDSPPVSNGPDAMLLSRAVSGTILVVSNRRTTRPRALEAAKQLRQAGANILGVVVNEAQEGRERFYPRSSAGRRFPTGLLTSRRQ